MRRVLSKWGNRRSRDASDPVMNFHY